MHRFNALTFTYVRVVCAQLPPRLHFPTPPTPPTALSHASSPPPVLGTFCAHWRWRLPQYVPTNYVYSRLQASDMHRQTNLAQLNWQLATGNWETLAWAWGLIGSGSGSETGSGCGSGSAHRGVPWHQRQRHQRIDSALAFWLFGWVTRCRRHSRCVGATTPTPTPTPTPSPSATWTRLDSSLGSISGSLRFLR